MAYLIFSAKDREVGRRALEETLVVGRAPDCNVSIHDILLSRRHCQIVRVGSGWAVEDLGSKNGTRVGGQKIARHPLTDGTIIRIGKTLVTFRAGKLSSASNSKVNPSRRPADPWEALSATMSGVEYVKSHQPAARMCAKPSTALSAPVGSLARFPSPQPSPLEPDGYEQDDIYSMLTELTSSSWDSIYLNASRPIPRRSAPRPMIFQGRGPRRSRTPAVADSLQVDAGLLAAPKIIEVRKSRRWSRAITGMARGFAAVGQMVLILGAHRLLTR